MVRHLAFHEQKLLKKVNLAGERRVDNQNAQWVMHRYHLPSTATYQQYARLVGQCRQLSVKLAQLPAREPRDRVFKERRAAALLERLYRAGLTRTHQPGQLSAVMHQLTVSSVCRRRLPVLMVRCGMAPTLHLATQMIEQGHVRVGPQVITDSNVLVARGWEDHVHWSTGSKYSKVAKKYRRELDDFNDL